MIKKYASTVHKNMLYELKTPTDEYNPIEFIFRLKHDLLCAILSIMKNGTLPIFIFDGQARPEKTDCIIKRRAAKAKQREKISNAYLSYISKHPLELTKIDDNNLLKLREQDFLSGRPLTEEEKANSITDYKNIIAIRELLEYIGFPTFTASHDAEKLCASLSNDGFVSAVLSNDTDNYVCGTKLTISKLYPSGQMEVVYLHRIIEFFQVEFHCNEYYAINIFRDFCIMCGCDFNTNIPGIAAIRAFNLLKQHGNIDNIGTIMDISCLKHIRCREIFNYEPSMIFEDKLSINPKKFIEKMNDLMIYFQSKILSSSYSLVNMNYFIKNETRFEDGI